MFHRRKFASFNGITSLPQSVFVEIDCKHYFHSCLLHTRTHIYLSIYLSITILTNILNSLQRKRLNKIIYHHINIRNPWSLMDISYWKLNSKRLSNELNHLKTLHFNLQTLTVTSIFNDGFSKSNGKKR